jgi:hypothetical protein
MEGEGRHFLWHLFAATALYLGGRALIANVGNPLSAGRGVEQG